MTLKKCLTIIYLWLTFTALTNGQYPGVPRNFFPPQSQPFTNPSSGGRQNFFSPGTQSPGFNSNHQTTNPQNVPQITNPQNFPRVINSPNFPQVTNPQNFPLATNPQNFPLATNPQNFPLATNPQNAPQVTKPQNFLQGINPRNFPQGINSRNFPQVANPQNIPQRNNPQNFPQITNPWNIPQGANPQNIPQVAIPQTFPQGANPQNIPQVANPQTFPQGINARNNPQVTNPQNFPHGINNRNNPQITNPQNFPQGINSQNFPQGINNQNNPHIANHQNFPQGINSQNFPRAMNSQNFPPINNLRNIPQVTNPRNIFPQNIPQATNPQNNPQITNSQSVPQISHFGSFPNRNFNVDEILGSLFPQGSRFNHRPVNRPTSFSPQNAASHNPTFISQNPTSSFTNPFHTDTQGSGPIFTHPQKIDRLLINPQHYPPFGPPPTASQISNVPHLIHPSSFRHHPIHPGFIAPQQASPSSTSSQEAIPISDYSQINRNSSPPQQHNNDSTNPQKTSADSTVPAPTNSDSTVPAPTNSDSSDSVPTNSDSTVPAPTNSDTTIPDTTKSDSTIPAPTSSDMTVTQQDDSFSTAPQQTYLDSTSPQKANPTLEGAQPIASASELSSSVSKAPEDTGSQSNVPHIGQASHNRSTKYRFNSGKQTNIQSQEDPLRGLRIVCLFNNKHFMTSGFTPANIDPSFCTHLNYEFAVLDPATYEIIIGEPDFDVDEKFYEEAIALKHVNPKLKVLLSLGGWADSTKKYSELADDPVKIQNFVIKAVEFLTKHGFDGLDLAWEYPNCWQGAIGVSPKDKQNFVNLLREMKREFKKHGLLLSVSVGAIKREVEAAYDVPEVSKNVDYINVMTYDMHGPWESKTSHHVQFEAMPGDTDPYCNVKGGMQVWIENGANKRKLNMGVAFYGRSFTMERSDQCEMGVPARGVGKPGNSTRQGGLLSYNEICKNLNSGDWIEKQDRHAGFYACSGDQWAGYDPPMMMVRKVKYVVESGLGGVLAKDLSGDDFKGECFSKSMPFPLIRMVKMEMEHKAKQKYP